MAGETERGADGRGPLVEIGRVYRLARGLTGAWLRTYHRLRIEGEEHVPPHGGVLLVANHASYLDIPVVANSTRRHISFVARASLSRSRFVNFLLKYTGAVLVEPGKPDRQALRDMVEHLRLGDCVAIFPEGTRSLDGRVGDFRGGVTLAARQTGVPIVPMGISGSFAALSRRQLLPRPVRITVRFGQALDPADPEALERAREAVTRLVVAPG